MATGTAPKLIVVGPDGVGKTPIAQSLAALCGVPYFKVSVEKEIFRRQLGAETLWFDYLLTQFLEQADCGVVSDRGYPCEWVYSRVFERPSNQGMLQMIDERHAEIGTRVLLLYSSTGPSREDELVDRGHYDRILQTYELFMRWTQCDIMKYDTGLSVHIEDTNDRAWADARQILELMPWD